ncbi:hypothetical protein B0T16DRAFT_163017 [Cercophora newfieldiana]|uniref:Uncharacterized protein n=1 Tax=Cercophora newfieldiana TaxID=92897 RepID=A0AA39Y5M4_9PEZI|nr:hypothetical protein B0T16DRAFT_163017 [Cercophora newfieldiana]
MKLLWAGHPGDFVVVTWFDFRSSSVAQDGNLRGGEARLGDIDLSPMVAATGILYPDLSVSRPSGSAPHGVGSAQITGHISLPVASCICAVASKAIRHPHLPFHIWICSAESSVLLLVMPQRSLHTETLCIEGKSSPKPKPVPVSFVGEWVGIRLTQKSIKWISAFTRMRIRDKPHCGFSALSRSVLSQTSFQPCHVRCDALVSSHLRRTGVRVGICPVPATSELCAGGFRGSRHPNSPGIFHPVDLLQLPGSARQQLRQR